MEIKLKIHDIDRDMIEMYTNDGRWLIGVVHIDSFSELEVVDSLFNGEDVVLTVGVK